MGTSLKGLERGEKAKKIWINCKQVNIHRRAVKLSRGWKKFSYNNSFLDKWLRSRDRKNSDYRGGKLETEGKEMHKVNFSTETRSKFLKKLIKPGMFGIHWECERVQWVSKDPNNAKWQYTGRGWTKEILILHLSKGFLKYFCTVFSQNKSIITGGSKMKHLLYNIHSIYYIMKERKG